MRVMVTGGGGFVGQEVVTHINAATDFNLTVPLRGCPTSGMPAVQFLHVNDISAINEWLPAVLGQDVIVHLAGRAHVTRESACDPLLAFRQVNVQGTLDLARIARDNGVKRFIFVSSIGVNGANTIDTSFNEESVPSPHADYAMSKFEAEQGLWGLCQGSDMELVIVRPPLVYAGHAPGNFARLLKLVASGIPLPFASVLNQRSMIALENLVDFITLCISHPSAGDQLFLVSDGEDLPTTSMLRLLAKGMGKPARLVPVPVSLMRWGAKALRREPMFNQLCGSLVIDSSKARQLLSWIPPVSVDDGLCKAAQDYLSLQN